MPVAVSDHSIHLFFDFAFDDAIESFRALKSLTMGDLQTTWIEEGRLATAPGGLADARVWEAKEIPVSSDLHPFVRGILDSRPLLDPAHPDADAEHPQCVMASIHARNLLSGTYRGEPSTPPGGPNAAREHRGLAVRLGHSNRIAELASQAGGPILTDGDEYALPLEMDGVRLHLFPTGVAVAVVTLHVVCDPRRNADQIDASLLIEALPLLCDDRRSPTLRWRDNWLARDAEGFTVRDMLLTLAEQCGLIPIQRERVFSLSSLVCGASTPMGERYETALRLSRHYNHQYRLDAESPGTDFVRPFETVLHAISSEGSCTIVDPFAGDREGKAAPHLSDWLDNANVQVYLPLHTVALHEYIVLLRLGQGAGNHIELTATTARDIAKLRQLCDRFLLFRLRYRLAQVSAITMHGLVYSALARRLGLHDLSEKMSHDLVTVERRLLELAAARRERRWRLPASLIAGGVAFLTLVTIGTRVEDALRAASVANIAVLAVGGLGAALGFFATWGQQQSAKAALENSSGIDS